MDSRCVGVCAYPVRTACGGQKIYRPFLGASANDPGDARGKKRKFELSHGQKYVKDRIKTDISDILKNQGIKDIVKAKPETIPRVLVDHEVGSGKSELAIQLVNDHLKKGQHAIVACPDSDNMQ